MEQAKYGDEGDAVMLSTTDKVLADWATFESERFDHLTAAQGDRFGAVLNAGAGRRISETEAPFLERFGRWYLLEPDDDRRAALGASVGDRDAVVLGCKIEELGAQQVEAVDFVLCKYVLQHIPTDAVAPAVRALRSVVAPGGRIALFLAISERRRSDFRLVVPVAEADRVPDALRRRSQRSDRQFSAMISRRQFDELMTQPQDFPFLATHHFGWWELRRAFPGFELTRHWAGVAVLECTV